MYPVLDLVHHTAACDPHVAAGPWARRGEGPPFFSQVPPPTPPGSTCLPVVVIAGKQAAFDRRLDLLPVAQFQNNVLLQMAGVGGVGGRGAGAAPGAGAR